MHDAEYNDRWKLGVLSALKTTGRAGSRTDPPLTAKSAVLLRHLDRAIRKELAATSPAGNKLVLDLGCGDSPYRPHVLRNYAAYVGLDLPGSGKADVYWDGQTAPSHLRGAADLVLSSQVLEHVPNVGGYLQAAADMLKPQGVLLLSTHGHFPYHASPRDYRRWTRTGLHHELEANGFMVETTHAIGSLGTAGFSMLRDAISNEIPARLRPLLHVAANLMLAPWLRSTTAARGEDAIVFLFRCSRK